jgi:hypothetical protein
MSRITAAVFVGIAALTIISTVAEALAMAAGAVGITMADAACRRTNPGNRVLARHLARPEPAHVASKVAICVHSSAPIRLPPLASPLLLTDSSS